MTTIMRIEIDFAIPVVLSNDDQRGLASIVQRIAKANEKPGRVHWLFGSGSKPLGETDHGMKFDDEILYFETAERAAYPQEQPQ